LCGLQIGVKGKGAGDRLSIRWLRVRVPSPSLKPLGSQGFFRWPKTASKKTGGGKFPPPG